MDGDEESIAFTEYSVSIAVVQTPLTDIPIPVSYIREAFSGRCGILPCLFNVVTLLPTRIC